jgi:hypothetical protein
MLQRLGSQSAAEQESSQNIEESKCFTLRELRLYEGNTRLI